MPRVPIEENRVGIADVTGAKLQAADLSGTGAQALGRGAQQFGQAGAQAAEQFNRNELLYDDAAAKKGWAELSGKLRPLLRTGDGAFYSQEGFGAHNALKPTQDAMEKMRAEIRAGFKTDRQRQMFDQAASERFGNEIEGLHKYANGQLKVEQNRQSEAVKLTSADDAVDHADDPVMFGEYVATGVKAIEAQAEAQGWAPETAKASKVAYVSGVHARVVDQMSIADPVGAATYVRGHYDELTPGDRQKLEKSLYAPMVERAASAVVDGYSPAGGDEAAPLAPPKAPAAVGGGSVQARMVAITAHSESGGRENNPDGSRVTSPAGARGLMQVMPATARDPGFGVKPSNGSAEDDARVGRDMLAKMVARYPGDPAKAWAAYNWGPGKVDAAIKAHGDGWFASAPKETRDYVNKNVRMLGGVGQEQAATYAPRRDDLAGIYKYIEGQNLSFDVKQAAIAEADRRVARNDKLLNRQRDDAAEAAITVIDRLGENFTSLNQLPADVRRNLDPATHLRLGEQARQNAAPRPVAANGDAIVNLHVLANADPAAFQKVNLKTYRALMTPGEYDQIATLQAASAKPNSAAQISHSRIWQQIGFYGRDIGVDMGAKGKNESDAAFQARRKDGMALFTVMQNYLTTLTEGKRQPTDDEVKRAFDNAVMPRAAADGTVAPRYRDTSLPTNSVAIPQSVHDSIRARLKAAGLPYDNQSVARVYMQGR